MTISLTIHDQALADTMAAVRDANTAFARRYPGDSGTRQPVHSVYGGGHLFRSDTAAKLGAIALRTLDEYAPDAVSFAQAIGLDDTPPGFARTVYDRVRDKLRTEPVEDFRIDFEDGYGARPDAEEDGHVVAAAREVAAGMRASSLPAYIGIRVKPLNEEWRRRSARTLDLFLTTIMQEAEDLPSGILLTLPKVTVAAQVVYFARLLAELERAFGLLPRRLRFEIMVETPQLIMDASGRCLLPTLLDAADGRLQAAHFGTYDYTASCNITAAHQRMQHPACQHALRTMQVAFAGTGVWLSDGSTTVLPVPVHGAGRADAPLTAAQQAENRAGVHRAWRMHFDDVRHSLAGGFYQGWDLHPAQLPTRYAALYAFFLDGLDAAGARLRNFVARAAQATLVGDVFDDAATGQGLLNYFLRAINCGAISADDAVARTDITPDEFRTRSFVRILERRRHAPARTLSSA